MLWINERMITEYDGSRHKEYDIHITRGDSGYLELVLVQDGVPYEIGADDELLLQVRTKPIVSDAETQLVFNGEVNTNDGVVWHIAAEDTERNCGVYFWDAQIKVGTDVYTFVKGRLVIEDEVTK